MWYILYCPKQNEAEIICSCKQRLSDRALMDAFILTYDRMRRYQGAWHLEQQPLFPNYVFLETKDGKQLSEELQQYQHIVQALGEKDCLIPLHQEEEQFLQNLCGESHHLNMSRGYISNGQTHVTEGPLLGKEEQIRRIDRHKRLARIETPRGHDSACILAGLEIVEKK